MGAAFAAMLPLMLLQLTGSVLFLVFGVLSLWRREDESEQLRSPANARWAVVTVAAAFLLAELGDKTQLATIALAATNDPLFVWLGATTAEIGVNAAAIGLATLVGSGLPVRLLQLLAATGFLVFGVLLLLEAFGLFQIG